MNGMLPGQFHFLRPDWFWLLVPLLGLLFLLWRRRLSSRSWRAVVDRRLLPYLLLGKEVRSRPLTLVLIAITGLLATMALAGPSWEKLQQPLFRQQSALVILLDLSRSMDAADLRPSRLQRARLKLLDILKKRREGQTALIAYAATAYTVSPLTTDSRTIAEQLPSLTTDLMPAQGSRPDRAIELALDLLRQAGVGRGSVLLVTDGVATDDAKALNHAVSDLTAAGHRLLVLGVGTAAGAPIKKSSGGFVTDANGAIVIAKLDAAALRALADRGQGTYRGLSIDDSDINSLLAAADADKRSQVAKKAAGLKSDQWRDDGVWLVLPLLLLTVFGFRRGVLSVLLAVLLLLPPTKPAMAMSWDALWLNDDQQGHQALEQGQAGKAAKLFDDPGWRAAAQYRAGKYEQALKTLQGLQGPEAAYNRGNALAQLHRFPEALQAYDQALKLAPDNADARHNRDLVKKALEQQQQKSGGERQKQKQNNSGQGQGQQKDSHQGGNDQPASQPSGQPSAGQAQGQQQDNQPAGARQGNADSSAADNTAASAAGKSQQAEQQQRQAAGDKQAPQQQATNKDDSAVTAQQQQAAPDAEQQQAAATNQRTADSEQRRATEQWLRQIPDDPGGLWRRKFLYQYQRQQHQEDEKQPW